MKAIATVLWVLCLGAVLGLLFLISNDRNELNNLAEDYDDVCALREKLVQDVKLLPEMRTVLAGMRPHPLTIPAGQVVHVGSRKAVLAWVDGILGQGYAAADLTIEPGMKKGQWRANLTTADLIER